MEDLATITITFSAPVTGVAPDDFLLNGAEATNVSGSGAIYTYNFPASAEGTVQAVWNPGHVIRLASTGSRLDDLDATTIWEYKNIDATAPECISISPLPGSTVGQLTEILVTFNEPVGGVNATDLQVNGQSARSVTGSGAGPYRFSIDTPAPGAVQIDWAANHGIHDLAVRANAFAGSGWTYVFRPGQFAGDVMINEFLAVNLSTNGLRDEDGELQDWIELYNRGTATVDLEGWSLTDDETVEDQWVFPSVTISPGQFLVVFASGKNRKPTNGAPLHTNFKLGASGQYLALFNANQPAEVATCFQPGYPPQRPDIAYGVFGSSFGYLTNATPGSANTGLAAFSGFAQKPQATVKSGFFNLPFIVSLNAETPQVSIRYTLDGSEPTPTSGTLYTGPITIAPTPSSPVVNLRAIAFEPGALCSRPSTFSYVFPSMVLQQPAAPAGFPADWVTPDGVTVVPADYEMDPQVLTNGNYASQALQALTNLPALSIVLDNPALFSQESGIYANPNPSFLQRAAWERTASAELITPDGKRGFKIEAGLRVQGGTSRDPNRTRKHSLRLFFNQKYDGKLDCPVFGDSPRTRFNTLIVDAGSNITWHNRLDALDARAQYIRDQFCSDLQNATGSPAGHGRFVNLFLNGLYWGVCYLHERPDEQFAAAYFGGDSAEFDVVRNTEGALEVVSGDASAWNAMMSLVNSGLSNDAQYEQIRQYLDIDRFIDYMIVNIWAGNTDWSMHNWYASRRRAPGAGFAFQMWDAEYTLESVTEDVSGYNHTGTPTGIHSFLRNNAEYRQRFADRVQRLCFNGGPLYVNRNAPAINPALPFNNRPGALYMQRAAEVDLAMVLESARWGDAAPGRENNPFTRDIEFANELNWLKTSYFPGRTDTVISQFRTELLYPDNYGTPAPSFNQPGGNVAAGFNLIMTAPKGMIYFTTDGSDPRVEYTGAVAPSALTYSVPVSVNRSLTVKARALNTSIWSPLTEATFSVGQLLIPVRITELMYRPTGGGAYEFLELQNAGATPLDLSGYSFDGITFSFPAGSILPPGAVAVLANSSSPVDWAARYPGVTPTGYYSGQLDNSGERIALKDAAGTSIVSVDYSSARPWPDTTSGRSIEIIDMNGDPDDPANWQVSASLNGTPGTIVPAPAPAAVQLNEIMVRNLSALGNGGTFPDWIELANHGEAAVNLSGWSLSDDGNPRKFLFPATNLPAGGYLLVFCDSAFTAPGLHAGFALADGETVSLYDPETNRVDVVSFGTQIADFSIGRMNSRWELTTPTPGSANILAALGSATNLKVNEWLANAAAGQPDWFEIYNPGPQPVELRGLYAGTANALFQITSLSFVAAGGYVQLFADQKPGVDHVDFKLPAGGSAISLYDVSGTDLDRVTYYSQTEAVSEGRYPDGSSTVMAFPASPSPGAPNFLTLTSSLQLNEVMARNDGAVTDPWGGHADWIELRNSSSTNINLVGVSLTLGAAEGSRWLFPAMNLAAGGSVIVWCEGSRAAQTNATAPLNLGKSLSAESGAIYLLNAAGQLVDFVQYGFQIANRSIGRNGGSWHLLASPTPGGENSASASLGSASNVRFNEWMANPAAGDDWFELYNLDSLPVELGGLHITDDPSIAGQTRFTVPPLSFIPAAGWVKFDADGDSGAGASHVNFKLSASGEMLRLYDADLSLIDSVAFAAQLPNVSQGLLPDGTGNIVDFSNSPTPGSGNFLPLQSVVINEVLTHTDPPLEDAIELINLAAQPVDVSGWYLSDSETALKKYQIPAGTILPAGGYSVFYEYQFNPAPGSSTSFALDSAHGDSVFLSEATSGSLTGRRTSVSFGAAANGVSFGRFTNSTGVEFTALSQRTFGTDNPSSLTEFRTGSGLSNANPKISPVVISELMYQPPLSGTNVSEQPNDQFIELFNASATAVNLYDPTASTNRWRLSGAVNFTFPPGVSMSAQSYLLVVSFDPVSDATALAAFRANYNVPLNVPVHGPFSGRLSNNGESLKLERPDPPQGPGPDAGFVPYILMDSLRYLPIAPWPVAAAGGGASLQRRNAAAYGNDPFNWKGEPPTAGTGSAQDAIPPVILLQPCDKLAAAGAPVALAVEAAGPGILRYRWQRDSDDLPEQTNEVLYFASVQPSQSGSYRVAVSNAVGTVWSQPATLTVAVPPVIVTNPFSQSVSPGCSVTLQVDVSGTAPLYFQWYRDGQPLAGATGDSMTISEIDSGAAGSYSVSISNAVGMVESAPAYLSVAALDSDGDGMSDAWELAHNLNPYDATDALIDSDGDGMLNADEAVAGTNPQDPESVLRLTTGSSQSGIAERRVNFTAIANIPYVVQWSSFVAGPWNILTNVLPDPLTRQLEIIDASEAGSVRFYRIAVPRQP